MSAGVLTFLSNVSLVVVSAACLPRAIAHLIRACVPVVTAFDELRRAIAAEEVARDGEDCAPDVDGIASGDETNSNENHQ
ncbi:hypothetical protein Pth03_21180 [Planotetraspora thailandica]|uniref:Uncharacterized protein n=1 Tax=Planotetraspora thailandica TaxID=487172 RepID=A0A8J3V470_9ACTN|nr:hypothetical protein [Planotetraspora thailandica]GII53729.1 hypothetical protein Pth03_21180 [Planotetraspora thailandica]